MNVFVASGQVETRDERSLRSKERVSTCRVVRSLSSATDEGIGPIKKNHQESPRRNRRRERQQVGGHDACVRLPQELHGLPLEFVRRRNKGPQRRGSLQSIYTESSENSVSFSTTKLGRLLSQQGFELDRDFEVETISADMVLEEKKPNPASSRSALVRQSMPARLSKEKLGNARSSENSGVRDSSFEQEKLRPSGRRQKPEQTMPSGSSPLSETKISKKLAEQGLKLEPEIQVVKNGVKQKGKGHVWRTPPVPRSRQMVVDTEQQCEECPTSYPGSTPSVSGSDITPTAYSEQSDVDPVADQPFIPISERVPVEELKARMEAKAARKKDIINRIKMMDSRLSTVLHACHEASQKLKMMDVPSAESDESEISSIVSDVSDVFS